MVSGWSSKRLLLFIPLAAWKVSLCFGLRLGAMRTWPIFLQLFRIHLHLTYQLVQHALGRQFCLELTELLLPSIIIAAVSSTASTLNLLGVRIWGTITASRAGYFARGRLIKFAKIRNAPGTPAGSWRNQA